MQKITYVFLSSDLNVLVERLLVLIGEKIAGNYNLPSETFAI